MPPSICLFCKRCVDECCYNIYDKDIQPHLSIEKLFGNVVSDLLPKNRVVCYECLYLIRWIYFIKQVFAEMIMENDMPDNPRVLAAFNIFKEKINQPVFLQHDEDVEALTQIEQECDSMQSSEMKPIDLSTSIHDSLFAKEKSRSKATQSESNVTSNTPSEISNTFSYFPCTISVCEQRFDTFDEIITHYDLHHGVDGGDIVLEDYADQLHEYNIQGLNKCTDSPQNAKKFKFRCLLSMCKRGFHSIDRLTTHKIRDHNLMAKFKCDDCFSLPFTSQIDLNQHIYENHQSVGLSCIYCALSFTNFRHYQIHIEEHVVSMRLYRRSSSPTRTEHVCKFCDKMFLDDSLLNAHVEAHGTHDGEESMILKRFHIGDEVDASMEKNKHRASCAFRMRVQQPSSSSDVVQVEEIVTEKSTSMNKEQSDSSTSTADRVRISLPPRKRRNYAIAVEEVEEVVGIQSPVVIEDNTITTNVTQEDDHVISEPSVLECNENQKEETSTIEDKLTNVDDPPLIESVPEVEKETEEETAKLDNCFETIPEAIKVKPNKSKDVRVKKSRHKSFSDESDSNHSENAMPCIVKAIKAVKPTESCTSGTLIMKFKMMKSMQEYMENNDKQKNHKLKRKKHSKAKRKSKHATEDWYDTTASTVENNLEVLETFAEAEETITLQVVNLESEEPEAVQEEETASTSHNAQRIQKKMKKDKKSHVAKKKDKTIVLTPTHTSFPQETALLSDDEDAGIRDLCIPPFLKEQCTISSKTVIVPKEAPNEMSNDALFSESDENAVPLNSANELMLNRDEINKIILGDRVCNDLPNLKTVAINEKLVRGKRKMSEMLKGQTKKMRRNSLSPHHPDKSAKAKTKKNGTTAKDHQYARNA